MAQFPPEHIPEWTLGDRLGKARRDADITKTAMAEYLGMNRVSLSRYETGLSPTPLYILRLWAMRCGVPLEWLHYGDTPPRPEVVASTRRQRKSPPSSTKWYSPSVAVEAA